MFKVSHHSKEPMTHTTRVRSHSTQKRGFHEPKKERHHMHGTRETLVACMQCKHAALRDILGPELRVHVLTDCTGVKVALAHAACVFV